MDLKDVKLNQVIDSFETNRCTVFIIKTSATIFFEDVYACVSIHKDKEYVNIRFGNKTQIEAMARVYVRERA